MKTDNFKIGREKRNYLGEFTPVIIAIVVLIVLILLLVFVFRVDITKFGGNKRTEKTGEIPFQEITVNPNYFSCSFDEAEKIIDEVGKVEVTYTNDYRVYTQYESDDPEGGLVDIYGYMYDIKFANIPKNVYIRISNNSEIKEVYDEITYENTKNGKYTYSFPGTVEYVTYTIEFIANDSSECEKSVIRKIEFEPDANNIFSSLGICTDEATWEIMKDFEYCSSPTIPQEKFLTFNEVIQKGNEYKEQKLKELEEVKKNLKTESFNFDEKFDLESMINQDSLPE